MADDELTTSPQAQLYAFARSGRMDALEELFGVDGNGLDVNAPDVNGKTPLHYAASAGRGPVVQFLLDQGADVAIAAEHTGDTALHIAAFKNHAGIVEILLGSGADVTAVNEDGKNPLTLADPDKPAYAVLDEAYSNAVAFDPNDLGGTSSDYSDDDDDDDE